MWVGVSESGYFVIDLFAERSDGSFFAYPALLLTAVGRLPLDRSVCLGWPCVCVCEGKYLRVSNNGTETSIKSTRQTRDTCVRSAPAESSSGGVWCVWGSAWLCQSFSVPCRAA